MWGEWLDRLSALAPRALRHPARVLELLADLRPMASVGPLTLAEVRQVMPFHHDPGHSDEQLDAMTAEIGELAPSAVVVAGQEGTRLAVTAG